MEERLQKIMARAGFGSRRANEALIVAGRVRVNGKVVRLGAKADPAADEIKVDGQAIKLEAPIYVVLNKPKGVLSSNEDELKQDRTTVRDLVDVPGHLYPVGRLDRQSRGLMLLTNDGELAHRLTHPRYGHEKVYKVVVEGSPSMETLVQWSEGVFLEGKMTLPATIVLQQNEKGRTHLRITLREGKKRQIRKVGAMLGHPVKQLTRIQLGTLRLDNLRPGEWRHLTEAEVTRLRRSAVPEERRRRKAPAGTGPSRRRDKSATGSKYKPRGEGAEAGDGKRPPRRKPAAYGGKRSWGKDRDDSSGKRPARKKGGAASGGKKSAWGKDRNETRSSRSTQRKEGEASDGKRTPWRKDRDETKSSRSGQRKEGGAPGGKRSTWRKDRDNPGSKRPGSGRPSKKRKPASGPAAKTGSGRGRGNKTGSRPASSDAKNRRSRKSK